MPEVSMTVNGSAVRDTVEGRTLLVEYLREHLHLTGTHVGCDTTQCGACIVHADGFAVKSCTMLALECEGTEITTIEGLAAHGATLHPMQRAFREHHALQSRIRFTTRSRATWSTGSRERQQCRPSKAPVPALGMRRDRCTWWWGQPGPLD
jgi:aerobic-type carbon monoxide dehydrogenase small subunit (CoxS/CutS family)